MMEIIKQGFTVKDLAAIAEQLEQVNDALLNNFDATGTGDLIGHRLCITSNHLNNAIQELYSTALLHATGSGAV